VRYTVASWVARNTDYLPEGSGALLAASRSDILQSIAADHATAAAPAPPPAPAPSPDFPNPFESSAGGSGGEGSGGGGGGSGAYGTGAGSPEAVKRWKTLKATVAASSGFKKTSSFLKKATVADSFMR